MHIAPATDGLVRVTVALQQQRKSFLWIFNWLSGKTTHDIAGAALRLDRSDTSLTVTFNYPSEDEHNDVNEKWTLSLPPNIALGAEMQEGMIQIVGMRGGVKAHLRAGDLEIQSPGGAIQATVDYGRLKVASATATPGVVTLHSEHGLAVLSLDGKYYGPRQSRGFFGNVHLFGNMLTERRGGKDNVDLNVYAGAVSLLIGPLRADERTYRDLFLD